MLSNTHFPEVDKSFFEKDTTKIAQELLSCAICVDGKYYRITETESYLGEHDLASHARFGNKGRSQIMFDEPGKIYVYLIYGMHHMLNFVAHKKGEAGAVLVRAIKDCQTKKQITGPGRLTNALNITKKLNNKFIGKDSGLFVVQVQNPSDIKFVSDKRVGVEYAGDWANKKMRFILTQ